MYLSINLTSKAAIKRAIASGERIALKRTSEFDTLTDGEHHVEGPWYPEPHRWYGTVVVENGLVTAIK